MLRRTLMEELKAEKWLKVDITKVAHLYGWVWVWGFGCWLEIAGWGVDARLCGHDGGFQGLCERSEAIHG